MSQSLQKEGSVKLVGSWSTEIGCQDQSVHILQYNNYKEASLFHKNKSSSIVCSLADMKGMEYF